MMMFQILLGLSLVVCLVGIGIRLTAWICQGRHTPAPDTTPAARVSAAIKGTFATLFSGRIVLMVKSLFVDLLFQERIFSKSILRWTAHTLIFFGFIPLLLFHAMGPLVSEKIFANYQSTLNPYLFLRNVLGLMVLAGVAIAVYRRLTLRAQRLRTAPGDWAALVFVGLIILSGMLLEGSRMASFGKYQSMVEEYGPADEEEARSLEAFWVEENGLASPNFQLPPSPELVRKGLEVNGSSCIECHASNQTAFAGFAIAKLGRPFFSLLGDTAASTFFWYLHLLACLVFLAWLPFSKMFHIFSAPVSLILKRVTGGDGLAEPANALTSRMIGLSACTHCGTCSLECSSNMFYESFGNDFILPSEKVQYLKKILAGRETDREVLRRMQEGLYVCTSCDRCTTVCPSGINLKELFVKARYMLLKEGPPEKALLSHFSFPLALAQNYVDDHLQALKKVTDLFRKSFPHLTDIGVPVTIGTEKSLSNTTYRGCYSCQRCTNICPVVRSYDNPGEALGMLPHQIMFSLGIGNVELAMGAQMIWSCSTCYLCQEHCPNQVELCDIFYSLKNGALNKIEAEA